MNTLISIKNLTKAYPIYRSSRDVLVELFTRQKRHDLFWALKDVSIEMSEGDSLGVIGPNGSGKSTLLKILTGTLPATSGSVVVNGNISAMLSLTSSLNPEESGISNIRFNLLLNGVESKQIPALTDEIIEFAELGPFIYSPVRTYSAGMNAKLAFAITTAIEPEILVIDEVLSVGDAYFVGKAIDRIHALCKKGRGVIFVSHSTEAVLRLCNKCVWMESGSVRMVGKSKDVVDAYEADFCRHDDSMSRLGNREAGLKSADFNQSIDTNPFRIRIVPKRQDKIFHDIHYVRSIHIRSESDHHSLSVAQNSDSEIGYLDLNESQWGRLYDRRGQQCRILAAKSGKPKGGLIIFGENIAKSFEIAIEAQGTSKNEQLTVEVFCIRDLTWREAQHIERKQLTDEWYEAKFRIEFPKIDDAELSIAKQNFKLAFLPDVEILNVAVLDPKHSKSTSNLKEGQPFSIIVEAKVNREIALLDLGINITRSDGYYVFFQSSGMDGKNLSNVLGRVCARFIFDQNFFAAGDYSISVYCGNGWDPKNNFPQSKVFARKVGATRFTIKREFGEISFGQVNVRVPVEIDRENQPTDKEFGTSQCP